MTDTSRKTMIPRSIQLLFLISLPSVVLAATAERPPASRGGQIQFRRFKPQ